MPKKCNATVESKPCDKSSFATCDGCQKAFCLPHLNTHQQQLATQMEEIVRDHDLLHEKLDKHRIHSTYEMPDFAHEFTLIDAWESRTLALITKRITQEADRARNIIRLVVEENRHRAYANEVALSEGFDRLKKRLAMLSEQLQERMKASDYLEPDLHQWNTELNDIKRFSLKPQMPTRIIVSKLIVGETKPIQIDVSNVLDIRYEDDKPTKAPKNDYETKDLVDTVKEKAVGAYNYVKSSEASNYGYQTERLVETANDKAVEAHNYTDERLLEARIFNNKNSNKKRPTKKS